MRFDLGDVVKVTQKLNNAQTIISFGVIVRLPIPAAFEPENYDGWEAGRCYRVRISTHSFHDFVEVGALAHEMEKRSKTHG